MPDMTSQQNKHLRGLRNQFHMASTQKTALAVCDRAMLYLQSCPEGHDREVQERMWNKRKESELAIDPKTYRWFLGKDRARCAY